jgi:hypothetical protein
MEPPAIVIGTPEDYSYWVSRLRRSMAESGRDANDLVRVDARYHYASNRITIYRLANPSDERSIADTLAHELLHAVLYQLGEATAARLIDFVGKSVGSPGRTGGI